MDAAIGLFDTLSVKPGTQWRQSRMPKRLSTKINTFVNVKVKRTGDNIAGYVEFVTDAMSSTNISGRVFMPRTF